ncbi:MAG: hypothetical protein QGH53_04900 [Prochlorococcaceae cyanobacterium ETNP18_MAG_1]|nr:hypothetical protein [Prochlorococcaceae cyanobacterium ETNP18_MAG_1]
MLISSLSADSGALFMTPHDLGQLVLLLSPGLLLSVLLLSTFAAGG